MRRLWICSWWRLIKYTDPRVDYKHLHRYQVRLYWYFMTIDCGYEERASVQRLETQHHQQPTHYSTQSHLSPYLASPHLTTPYQISSWTEVSQSNTPKSYHCCIHRFTLITDPLPFFFVRSYCPRQQIARYLQCNWWRDRWLTPDCSRGFAELRKILGLGNVHLIIPSFTFLHPCGHETDLLTHPDFAGIHLGSWAGIFFLGAQESSLDVRSYCSWSISPPPPPRPPI